MCFNVKIYSIMHKNISVIKMAVSLNDFLPLKMNPSKCNYAIHSFPNDCSNDYSIFCWSETLYLILFNFSIKMLRHHIKIILKLIPKCLVNTLSLTSDDGICSVSASGSHPAKDSGDTLLNTGNWFQSTIGLQPLNFL